MKNNRFRWNKMYLYWGITAFCVIAAAILLFLAVSHWRSGYAIVKQVVRVLMPVIYGLLFAYLLNKPMIFFEKKIFKKVRGKTPEKAARNRRALSVLATMGVTIAVVVSILWLILPQIYLSLESLVVRLPGYFNIAMDWVQRLFEGNPELEGTFLGIIGSVEESLIGWIRTTLLTQINTVLTGLTSGVIGIVREVLNLAVGLVVAVYALYHKEKFAAQFKKMLYAVAQPKWAGRAVRGLKFIDFTCGSFITSKLIDSLIVGVVTWAACMIAKVPYAALIAVIVGITNVIPFFGPFIGGIPSALLVLLESPVKCVIFIIIIIVIQQLDGNVLFPRLQGTALKMSGFWILFAILLFGGLFGFWGFILAVPVFSVIYHGVQSLTASRLAAQGLPTDTESYIGDMELPADQRVPADTPVRVDTPEQADDEG